MSLSFREQQEIRRREERYEKHRQLQLQAEEQMNQDMQRIEQLTRKIEVSQAQQTKKEVISELFRDVASLDREYASLENIAPPAWLVDTDDQVDEDTLEEEICSFSHSFIPSDASIPPPPPLIPDPEAQQRQIAMREQFLAAMSQVSIPELPCILQLTTLGSMRLPGASQVVGMWPAGIDDPVFCLLMYSLWSSHRTPRQFMPLATKLVQCLGISVPKGDLLRVCTVFIAYSTARVILRSLRSDYLLASRTLAAQAEEAAAMAEAAEADREARQTQTEEAERRAHEAKIRLNDVRERVSRDREALELAREEAERARNERLARQERLAEKRRQEVKSTAERYRADMKAAAEREAQERSRRTEAERERRQRHLEQRSEAIGFRQSAAVARYTDLASMPRRQAQAAREAEERLQRAAESLGPQKPEHTDPTRSTESWDRHVEARRSARGAAPGGRVLSAEKVTGFNESDMMDQRTVVAMALADAGLLGTEAATNAISFLSVPEPAHMRSEQLW